MDPELVDRTRAWIAGDPDPVTRATLQAMLDTGDEAALRDHMGGSLPFGTAGLRGRVGPGSRRINRAVALRTARGLADHLLGTYGPDLRSGEAGPAVVGYDARPSSPVLAGDVVAVLAARGVPVRRFTQPVPTPLVAFEAVRSDAVAAVVVTASHNPPADNGIKVYARNHVQLVAPEDAAIAALIDRAPSAAEVNAATVADPPNVTDLDGEVQRAYVEMVLGQRVDEPRDTSLRIVVTPLHGVGGAPLADLLRAAGYDDVHLVAEQAEPDGTFPTVAFPNPEEPGAMDLAVALARRVQADVVIANDPDADRLAVAIPDGAGSYVALSGNQVGGLLGDRLLATTRSTRPAVASSIVSSPLLADIAAARGARHEPTLTGFKWIWNCLLDLAAEGYDPVYGYEEALGYAVSPAVRDKDGLSAALAVVDLAAGLRAQGRGLRDALDDLARRFGVRASTQASQRLHGSTAAQQMAEALQMLRSRPPRELAGRAVRSVVDYAVGGAERPRWLGEQDLLAFAVDGGRVLVRPSGTEPKLKVYVDLVAAPDADLSASEVAAAEAALGDEARRLGAALLAAAAVGRAGKGSA